jgi:ABC-2 type transport system ATP-binding protein
LSTILVRDLKKFYEVREGFRKRKVVEALRGISFSVGRGEIHAMLGPNGAGKTTTIKILATLLLPDGGEAYVAGFDVVKQADEVRRRVGISLDVSKGFYPSLSGYENLVFYGLLKGFSISYSRRRAKELLELVGLEGMKASYNPYFTYSLGMRAKLSIAKALFSDPEVLLLDEPTLGLDVESARMIRKLITELARDGKTVLITGHNMYEIEEVAQSVTIINNGVVVASGTPEQLKLKFGLLYKVSILLRDVGKDFVEVVKSSLPLEGMSVEDLGGSLRITMYVRSRREELVQTLLNLLERSNTKVLDISIKEPTLEDVYVGLIGGGDYRVT